tara:strand:- start:1401 stop:1718 length:318 start_codon:yes stop_codon:yes gene_type:complete
MINFNVTEHHFLNGFHLQTTFPNGFEVSIIPSEKHENLYEIAVLFGDFFIDSLQKFDRTSLDVLIFANEVKNFNQYEIDALLDKAHEERDFMTNCFESQDSVEIM